MTTTGGNRTVELWVRSFAPTECTPRRDRVLDRLESLVETGALDDVAVRVWGDKVAVDPDQPAPAREILDRVERFREWADSEGLDLAPAFERRTVECVFTDERYVSQRLPAMAMAEYESGEVRCVTPHRREETAVSVADRVARLAGVDGEGGPREERTSALTAD